MPILVDSVLSTTIFKNFASFNNNLIGLSPINKEIKLISTFGYKFEYICNNFSFILIQKKNEHPFSKLGKDELFFKINESLLSYPLKYI